MFIMNLFKFASDNGVVIAVASNPKYVEGYTITLYKGCAYHTETITFRGVEDTEGLLEYALGSMLWKLNRKLDEEQS